MKSIKICIITMILIMGNSAFAGTTSDSAGGAILGAIVGRAGCHNCNARNQNLATGAGALAGGLLGYSVGDRQDRREAIQQSRGGFSDTVNSSRTVRTVDVSQGQPMASEWVEQPVVQTRYVEPVQVRTVRQPAVVRDGGCDEQYFHGTYNPEAAQAYCQGRRERERMVREAYAEGLAGR
jgi:hypothetical protein